MLRRILPICFTLAALTCLASANATQDKQPKKATPEGKHDEQAKAVALEFCKVLLTTTDVDNAMKMVALPFFHQDLRGKVGKSMSTPLVAKKLDEVKQEIAAYIALGKAEKKFGDVLKQPKLELEVTTYEQFLAHGN